MASAVGRYLYRDRAGVWVALVELYGYTGSKQLDEFLTQHAPGSVLVDYREASAQLVADYQFRTLVALIGVFVVIAGLLLWRISPRRAAWALAVVLVCVLSTAAALRWVGGPLNIYHLTGLLLVAGIGLDYGLFLTRPGCGRADDRHAVASCAASTAGAFGVLAASSIPALQGLGRAVALGTALCFLVAWLGTATRSMARD